MNRLFYLFFAVLGLLAPSAAAQGAKAEGKLYTRTVGDEFQAAIVIKIDRGFHLYHWELGGKNATGKPLTVELQAPGVELDGLEWPEPHRYPQEDFEDGGMTYILGHEKKLTIYGHGKVTGDASVAASVSLNGLTCEDGGTCVPYVETLTSTGEGSATVWTDYPSAAWASAGVAVAGGSKSSESNTEAKGESIPAVKIESGPPRWSAASSDSLPSAGSGGKPAKETLTREADGLPPESGSFGAPGKAFAIPSFGEAKRSDRASGELITRTEGDKLEFGILIDIDEGYHLYHKELGGKNATGKPLEVTLQGEGIEFDELVWPEPHQYEQEDFMDGGMTYILGHEKRLMIYGSATLASGASADSIRVELDGLTCEDNGVCVPYSETLSPSGEGDEATWEALRGLVGGIETPGKQDEGLLALILAAIGGGIFALLMPCTYPMIPITISFFTKQAEARGGKVWPLSLTYGVGIVVIFIAIGLLVGPIVLRWATHPATNLVLGLMFVVFAAALFGAITLSPPAKMMNLAGKASMKGGLIGVFLMGTTLVLTSFTCTAPFVGSLLSIAASGAGEDGNLMRVILGMGVFGLTMAVPFTLLSLLPGKIQSMPSSGEWMDTLKVSLGFVELAAAMKFFSNADLVWEWGVLSRELFLLIWGIIFLVGGIYLMGWIHVKGHSSAEIGSGRMLGALGFLLFGAYCMHGYNGHSLDGTMTAIIPPYSSAPEVPYSAASPSREPRVSPVVEDNHTVAKRRAIDESKPLLLNFTGVT